MSRQHIKRVIDWAYWVAWSRSTQGALIVVGSAIYIVCALMALPLRHEADVKMREAIARGEVAMMAE